MITADEAERVKLSGLWPLTHLYEAAKGAQRKTQAGVGRVWDGETARCRAEDRIRFACENLHAAIFRKFLSPKS